VTRIVIAGANLNWLYGEDKGRKTVKHAQKSVSEKFGQRDRGGVGANKKKEKGEDVAEQRKAKVKQGSGQVGEGWLARVEGDGRNGNGPKGGRQGEREKPCHNCRGEQKHKGGSTNTTGRRPRENIQKDRTTKMGGRGGNGGAAIFQD